MTGSPLDPVLVYRAMVKTAEASHETLQAVYLKADVDQAMKAYLVQVEFDIIDGIKQGLMALAARQRAS